jgi:acetoin utilization protein AcuB
MVSMQPIEPDVMTLSAIMKTAVASIGMDATLAEALELCAERRIRHLPVVDEEGRLVGILTDRDIRYHLSPRLGTLSENNTDRASMQRRVHMVMSRQVIVGTAEMTIAEGARLMVRHRLGCIPIIDPDSRIVGIITTTDYLLLLSGSLRGRASAILPDSAVLKPEPPPAEP